MKKIPAEVAGFLEGQGFVLVSTLDSDSTPHASCKGIVKIEKKGVVYLLDLYMGRTYLNLKRNPRISLTTVDEHKFKGYCLKGKAKILSGGSLGPEVLQAWEDKITGRIAQRVLRNIRQEKGHPRHPEAFLPKPKYLIAATIEEIVDLTPRHLK